MNARVLLVTVLALVAGPIDRAYGSRNTVGGRVFRPGSESITPATAQLIGAWVQAVHKHVPGSPDESVAVVRRLTYQDRVEMNAGIDLFFDALEQRKVNTGGNKAAESVVAIAHGAGMPDPKGFYERAAILHTDAVVFGERFEQAPDRTIPPPTDRRRRSSADSRGSFSFPARDGTAPPLLTNTSFVAHRDGEVLGTAFANWNWVFARSLLDRVVNSFAEGAVGSCRGAECTGGARASLASASSEPFIGAWYHATAAYMLADGLYGDATDHLHRAGEVLPNDARIAFDRASYAEILGLPPHQVLLADSKPGLNPRVPPLDKTNAEAEDLFRRAIELDPSLVEARVRLGRLLEVRGAHAEALAELKTALAANPKPIVTFYAHLFAARASQALGDIRGAAVHYDAALALYPHAQSALLGVSQAALLAADVPAAIAPIERLGAASARFEADPWRAYQLAAGRDVNELMHQLWAMSR
jgi:tetratricopeptide (TPR) repeat protein